MTTRREATPPLTAEELLAEAREAAKGERYNGVYQRGYFDGAYKHAALDAANPAPVGWCREHEQPGALCRDEIAANCDIGPANPAPAVLDVESLRLLKYLWSEAAIDVPSLDSVGHVSDLFKPTDPLYEDIEDVLTALAESREGEEG